MLQNKNLLEEGFERDLLEQHHHYNDMKSLLDDLVELSDDCTTGGYNKTVTSHSV